MDRQVLMLLLIALCATTDALNLYVDSLVNYDKTHTSCTVYSVHCRYSVLQQMP